MVKFCAHLGYLFTELPLEDRFAAAAEAGFGAVEHPNPYAFGTARFRDAAHEHGLRVAQIAAPNGDAVRGEKGFACLADRVDDFRESVDAGIAAATVIGTPLLHVMPGVLPSDRSRTQCRDTYLANMAWAANRCAAAGLTSLIEPISDETVPGFYVHHPTFAAALLRELDHAHARMLFDVYHAAVKGLELEVFLEDHIDLIAHVQIADHPGRHEPGTGTLAFDATFSLLDNLGYTGWVGCEYNPRDGTQESLGWLQGTQA